MTSRLNPIRVFRKEYKRLSMNSKLKLPAYYFINCVIFDLVNETETHAMLAKKDMKVTSKNFSNGLMYMASWDFTLESSYKWVKSNIDLANTDFVDLGCGKGKAVLYARKSKILSDGNNYYGIDFDCSLIEIARENSRKMFGDIGEFWFGDALDIDWNFLADNLLIYIYNPFSKEILSQVIQNLVNKNVTIIYCNPVENDLLVSSGFETLFVNVSWHANLDFIVYQRTQKKGVEVTRHG